MKTKTQEQLEKEILFKQKFKPVLTPEQFKELLRLCVFSFDFAKKNFEKLIGKLKVYPTEITEGEVIYGSVKMINKEEIKEALKEL